MLVKSRVFSVCLFKSAFEAGVCPGISLFLARSESVDVFSTQKVGLGVKGTLSNMKRQLSFEPFYETAVSR